jgi:DNA-binding NtrC family response regulator
VIHEASSRRDRPFIAVACSRLPSERCRELLSTASAQRMGWRGGTLFLREPQSLPLDLQRNVLARLGQAESADLRIAAAISVEPDQAVRQGLLLFDLAQALSTLAIRLPPLRERPQDLLDFVHHFLADADAEGGREALEFTDEAMDVLRRHHWPRNLHELRSVISGLKREAKNKRILVEDLPTGMRMHLKLRDLPASPTAKPPPLDSLLEQVERRMISLALRKWGGNRSKAAEWLGIWRPRLLRRLEALGLDQDGPEK